jgi:hypothetical protein
MATAAHLPPRKAPPFTCSPRTPWGIHPALADETCLNCGWSRSDDRRETRAREQSLC